MSNICESSSSSDDDDMLKALKEATDTHFLKESLFHSENETGNNARDVAIELPKSLRRNVEFVEEASEFGVTQDFKNFVAKQLAKALDKCVEEIHHERNSESNTKKKRKKIPLAGIKLLSNSQMILNDIENNDEQIIGHNKRWRKEKTKDNSAETISKCREVAVQPSCILSRASTAVWTNKSKGVVYKYKKSESGTLIKIN